LNPISSTKNNYKELIMFIEKRLPMVNQDIFLKEGKILYTLNGKFIGPHTFRVVDISLDHWLIEDEKHNEAFGTGWDEDMWDY